MSKKETSNVKETRFKNYGANKMNKNTSENPKKNINKDLPWWVELLFVQLGLPDKLLVKILKTKKKANQFFKDDKKSLITFLFVITIFAYFYPVVKHSKNKLNCEKTAKIYITKNKDISKINTKELNMLSTNFCYGGEGINEIENLKD